MVIIVFDSVRAKAIVCLAGCTESEEDDLRTAIRDLVVLKTTNENGGNLPGCAIQTGNNRVKNYLIYSFSKRTIFKHQTFKEELTNTLMMFSN